MISAWGTGKTMTALLKGAALSLKYPNNLGLVLRKNFTDLKDSTMSDFTLYTGMKIKTQSKSVEFANGSKILFHHADELAGVVQNINLGWFFIEQAEEFDNDAVFQKLRGRLRRRNCRRQGFIIANANGHNWCWRLWKQNPHKEFSLVEATTFDNAQHLSDDFLADLKTMEQQSPAHYRRYVLNSHEESDTEDRCIPYEHLRRAINAILFTLKNKRRVVSCDPAEFGDDRTVIMAFEDGKLIDCEINHKQEPMTTAGKIQLMMRAHGAETTVIDEIGIGAGIRSALSEFGLNVMGVNVGAKSDEPGKFRNLKAEIWMNAQKMFRENKVCIPDNESLIEELAAHKYLVNSRGLVQIEKKSDTKQRLGFSPDLADAFVLGLYGISKLPEESLVDYEEEDDTQMAKSYTIKSVF